MKVLWLLAVSALSFPVLAQSTRDIYDLMYLPKAGTIFGQTQATYGMGSQKVYDESSKSTVGENTQTLTAVDQLVGYGLMDNLSLSASIGYAMSKNEFESDASGVADSDNDSDGVTDPLIEARYRVMDSGLLMDVLVGGQISIGDAKSPNNNKDGNQLTGGHEAGLGLQVGQDNGGNQWAARIGWNYVFEATDKTAGVTTDSNAHNQYILEVLGLIGVAQNLYLVPIAQYEITESYNDDQGGKTSQLSQINLGAEARFVLNKDLMVRAGLVYTNLENAVEDDVEFREDWFLTATASLNYQF